MPVFTETGLMVGLISESEVLALGFVSLRTFLDPGFSRDGFILGRVWYPRVTFLDPSSTGPRLALELAWSLSP